MDPDLVAWWEFEEPDGVTAKDSTANRNDGLLTQQGVSGVEGKIGRALAFDGTIPGRVLVSSSNSLGQATTAMTVAMWLRLQEGGEEGCVLEMDQSWKLLLTSAFPRLNADDGRILSLDTKVAPGDWHHVAFVFDSGKVRGYIDGVKQASALDTFAEAPTNTPLPALGSEGLSIGAALPVDAIQGFTGEVDEVRLYRRALGDPEIAALAH
jgi:hypothetical protein